MLGWLWFEMEMGREILEILRERRIILKRGEGQRFLIDERVAERMLEYAAVSGEDVVLEIGAGIGNLTKRLEERAAKVYAVEKDKRLCEILRERCKNAEIIEGDVLRVDLPPFNKVIANLPFHLSSPITLNLLLFHDFDIAVLTYQREFAEKMVASPDMRVGKKKIYGRLSVIVQTLSDVEILEIVPRSVFFPQPSVDAAIVRLKPKDVPELPTIAERSYFCSVVGMAFSRRRRKLKNIPAFKHVFFGEKQESAKMDEDDKWLRSIADLRPDALKPSDFVRLSVAMMRRR